MFDSIVLNDYLDPETGKTRNITKPYLIDLGSANKTYLNGREIEDAKYYELKHKDCLKFAGSTREYVLLREDAK